MISAIFRKSRFWASLLGLMMVAGAVCGVCIGWSYGLLVEAPSTEPHPFG
jgi:hypothetical protein